MVKYHFSDSGTTIQLRGAKELNAKVREMGEVLTPPQMRVPLADAGALVEAFAKIGAPKDMGRLYKSIGYDVRPVSQTTMEVGIGPTVHYGPYMELGTGVFVGKSPHCPPGSALNEWAHRHGFPDGWIVAGIICARGGLEPRHYLKKAVEMTYWKVIEIFDNYIERALSWA